MKMCYTWGKEMIMDLLMAKKRYRTQKAGAKHRNIEWLFTFETWIKIWTESGKWEQRGNKGDQYCMTRPGDIGPYSPDNVVIKTNGENASEARKNYPQNTPPSRLGKKNGTKWYEAITKINTPERAQKISDTLKAKYAAQGGSKIKGRKASPEELVRRSNAAKLMWQQRKAAMLKE